MQRARTADGRTVAQSVIDAVGAHNRGSAGLGSFGVVIGATIGEPVADLSAFGGPCLVPGIGAQGGTPADVRRIFGSELAAVLPSVSREVLAQGPTVSALRTAARRSVEQFAFLRSGG